MTAEARTPPYSAQAEFSVLGAVFVDPDTVTDIRVKLRPEDFYRMGHRRIFRSICRVTDRGEAVDPVTLAEDLKDRGELEAAGGHTYIAELIDAVPTAANVEHHVRIVRKKAKLRRIIQASRETIRDALEANGDADAVLEDAERRIFEATDERTSGAGYQPPTDAIFDAMRIIEREGETEGGVTGIPTGIPTLDRMTTGLQKGGLTILAARPAMGKSALASSIATNAARKGHTVAISSLEMTQGELMKRALASRAGVDLLKIRRGELEQGDYEDLTAASGWLHNLPLRIDDRTGATVPEIRAKVRRLCTREDVDLVVIDYLQLMDGEGENRVQQVGSITRGLKRLAREFDLHVLALSQLSRKPEHRSPPRPILSDLRDSGTIEQDADNVLLLWRPAYYFDDSTSDKARARWEGKGELIVGKQRNGPTGRVLLRWDAPTTTFTELALEHGSGPWGGR